ncbi:hypothetical protein [Polymorphum gilvum]|uniref:Uncharacterized protein n=1 Tax=Polymorphum gilvum (strain LMG 25793 / CGMCC 1.9160 / SL003B-26A1) TaxID=991905 RepID=F2J1G1_POLGS|nr:hypothetical protein [Polymorphum gilvum]ADZ69743.1 hypothetical protein SL003B_1315 [Polymorphum gilvum SL003B-26A1]
MMPGRVLLVAAVVAVSASPAFSARPDLWKLTCAEARDLLARHGRLTMNTGPRTYEQFVATGAWCLPAQVAVPAVTATRDTPACDIGWSCIDREPRTD